MRLQTLFLQIKLRAGNSLYPSVAGFELWERCLDLYRDKIHWLCRMVMRSMKDSRNIYLIGPMGAGKTTVGRQIAKHLSLDFYDSDLEIESRTGVDIPMIFEYEGEDGFRKRESTMIAELIRLSPIVMATGGGAVLDKENRQFLSENGFVVYLQCSINRLLQRTAWDNHRPLLNEGSPRAKIEGLMEVRSPLYESCADFIVNTGNLSTRLAVKQIIEVFQSSSNNH